MDHFEPAEDARGDVRAPHPRGDPDEIPQAGRITAPRITEMASARRGATLRTARSNPRDKRTSATARTARAKGSEAAPIRARNALVTAPSTRKSPKLVRASTPPAPAPVAHHSFRCRASAPSAAGDRSRSHRWEELHTRASKLPVRLLGGPLSSPGNVNARSPATVPPGERSTRVRVMVPPGGKS